MNTFPVSSKHILGLYLLGLLLAIGGCGGILVFKSNLLYLTIVLYVVGLILAVRYSSDNFSRFMAFVLPAVVFFSIYTVTQDNRVREPEIWLIQEGYTGPVYVFLKEKCGEEPQNRDDRRIYNIINGEAILYSRESTNYGIDYEDHQYFYRGASGTEIMLPEIGNDTLYQESKITYRDSLGQPIYVFPGPPYKGESVWGKFHLQYAYIGTYPAYMQFMETTTLPDSVPEALLNQLGVWRKSCDDRK